MIPKSVDIAFIAEGYRTDEMDKFHDDVKKMADPLFSDEPFAAYEESFNIWAVDAVSQDSGTDVPGEGIYVNTALNSSFYTFDLDRYLTTQDIKSVNDYAAAVPHDVIIVLINSTGMAVEASIIITAEQLQVIVSRKRYSCMNSGMDLQDLPMNTTPLLLPMMSFIHWMLNPGKQISRHWWISVPNGKKSWVKGIPVPTPAEEKYKKCNRNV